MKMILLQIWAKKSVIVCLGDTNGHDPEIERSTSFRPAEIILVRTKTIVLYSLKLLLLVKLEFLNNSLHYCIIAFYISYVSNFILLLLLIISLPLFEYKLHR